MSNKNADYYFLKGGGEMGKLIRAKDWSKTSLGDPAEWPQSLRTMVAVMLDNRFGMYIAWGSEYIQLYNDAYRPILGATKHPQALGISTKETFSEIWDNIIGSMFDDVMQGEAVGFPDFMLPLNRNGFVEECYFDFSYSPIRKDNGEVGGVLVTVIETTEKKRATAALKGSNNRFISNIMQAPVAMCIFRGKEHVVEIANEQMLSLWGKQAEEVMNKPIFEGLPEARNQGLEALVDQVYATGEKFVANERPVNLPRNGKIETVYLNFVYDALKETDGTISGIVAIAMDITPQIIARSKVEESEQKVRALVENAPFPIAVYVGKEMIVELANQSIIDIWGKGNDVIGKSFKEVLPELDNQSVFEQIQKVLETGESFHTKNTPLDLIIDGKPYTYYFNYSFTPLYDTSGNIYGVMNTGVDLTELNIAKKKIEESEEQLRIAIEGGEFGTFDFIAQTNQLIWSGKTKELFGLPPNAPASYDTYIAALHPEDRGTSRAVAQQQANLKEGGLYELEYRTFGITDGKLRWLRSKGKATYNKEGEPIRYTGVIQDITKRKEAEQALKESEERFRTMADNISQLAWMANEKGQMIWFNKRWLEYSGTTMEQMLNDGAKNIHHPEHRSRVMDKYLKAVEEGKEWEDTFPLLGADGKYRWFLSRAITIKNADGKVKQWFGTNTDITQRMEAEEALKESEEKFRTMAESSDILIGVNNETVNAVYFNKAWEKLTGRPVADLINLGWSDLLHPEDRQLFLDKFFYAFERKESYSGEFRILNKDGNYNWLYSQVQVRLHPDGSYAGHISSCIDITERKKSEEEIKRFKFMADNASEPFILMRADGTFEYLNKAALEKWGYTAEEAKSLRVPDVDPIYNDEAFANIFVKAQNEKIPIFETLHKKKDGNIYPVEVNMGAFQIADTYYLFSVARDISERKKADEALKESEQRLRSLVEGAPFPIGVYTGREMEIQLVNQSILDVWGKDRDVIGKKFAEVLPELEGTGLYESLDKVFSTGIPFHDHNRPIYLTAFGKDPHYFNYSFTALYDAYGKIYGVLNTAAEVTEMEIARQKVEESEERFRNVANSAPVLIWMADTDQRCYFFNKGWLNFTGRTMEQESGHGWTEGVHPDDLQKCMDIYLSSFDKRAPFYMEYRLKRHDGAYRWLSDNGVPRFTSDGVFEGYIGACMDIEEQKKAEEQFKALADQAPMWVWLTDKEVNVLYTNPEVLKFLGIAHYAEFTGNTWEQKVHPEDIGMVYRAFGEAASLQQSFSFEFRVLNASTQQYEWFYIKAVPRLESGEFTGFIGTGININEQRLILSQLEYRKALLEAHNESSLDGILLVDTKGKILSWNHRFVKIWNMQQQILEDKDDEAALAFALTQLVKPEQFKERVKWMYENPEEISIDELEFKDGKIIERHGYHVAGADGNYYGCSWMFRDITQQKKYERAVKESEEKFRLLADSMPQHIWTSDPEGNLNYYNQSVFDYSGLNIEQINKDGWIQIVHPDDREENIKQWFHAISTGQAFLFEHRFRRYDGEYRWQLSRAIPQRDANGKIQMWVGSSTDIQDQKTFTKELQLQVSERTKELEASNSELQRMNKELQSFAYISSHDLQEPLRKIQTFASRIKDKEENNLSDSGKDMFNRMQDSAKRMQTLIQDLLAYSRTNATEQKLETTSLNKIIAEVKEDLKEELTEKHAAIEANQLCDADIIPFQFRQLMHNLIGNSLKFSNPDNPPRIQIKGEIATGAEFKKEKLSPHKKYCHISVADNGIGFEQQYSEKIFEVFQRLHGKNEYNGTGIGLSIVKKIIENHHGIIMAKSELNKGATFDIYIPAT